MSPSQTCPNCGAPLPDDAPRGLCPNCLLGAALSRSTGGSGEAQITVTLEPAANSAPDSTARLAALAETLGRMPSVLLRDTDAPAAPEPMLRPDSPELPDPADRSARLQLFGEIARGGMGAVLKGRDPDLGRELAVKVLLERHRDNPDLIRRFVEEAQIGGQLQHPGVVPIYELGAFADRRPYFAMKLVKGQTLATLLAARPSPADGLPKFLGIFEQVCQTVAYAHARGVIHRDLKPSNVMVGSFGEVQVMDWGLAKVLPRSGAADDAVPEGAEPPETVVATVRSDSDANRSRAGSVMGTPAYMAPEQARGEVEHIDERADVFALGSILCEVLTGSPAFTGRSSSEVLRRASRGETDEALTRLDACDAEAELVALARDCLAIDPADRPRDARAVSDRMTAYLVGVQERLRAAEVERARAEARAAEERKRRKLQLGLAASVLALAALGGLAAAVEMQRRNAVQVRVAGRLAEATARRDQARRLPDDPTGWRETLAAARRVEDALSDGGAPDAARQLAALKTEAAAGLEAAERDAVLAEALLEARANLEDVGPAGTDDAYARAFAEADLDLRALGVAEASDRLRRRRPERVEELAAYLDHWSAVRREAGRPADEWRQPLEVARVADPDEYRGRLRDLLAAEDPKAEAARLRALANDAGAAELPPPTALLLADALARAGGVPAAVALLEEVAARHPEDLWAHFTLAGALERLRPPRREEAVRHYTAARALRPETAHELAHLLERMDRDAEAEAVFRDLTRRRPEEAWDLGCFGRHLKQRGRAAEAAAVLGRAIAAGREAVRLRPDDAAVHYNLGNALRDSGDLPGAIAAFREAVRLRPEDAESHFNLGNALADLRDLPGAIAAFREAVRLRPDYAEAHSNLGLALADSGDLPGALTAQRDAIRLRSDLPEGHYNLGVVLHAAGDLPGAIAAYQEAIRLQPDLAEAHFGLGNALRLSGDLRGATAAYRDAIRLRPDYAESHTNLGLAMEGSGNLRGAIAAYQEAIRLQPDLAEAHFCLGNALRVSGDLRDAIAEYRETIRLNSEYAEAHCNLGLVLLQAGNFAEGLAELRRGHELGSNRPGWPYPSAEWVREAERLVALIGRLKAVLSGEAEPTDNAERLALARIAYDTQHDAAAARLFAEALQSDPSLAEDHEAQHRYNAACAAALAAAGQGRDDPTPDDAEKAAFRAQALGWLRSALAAWSKVLDSDDPEARDAVAPTLQHWKQDPDLASVRDEAELAKLPEAERAEWQALWDEVGRLIERSPTTRGTPPSEP